MSACKITASVYPESIVWGTNYVKKNKEFQRVKLFQISPKRIANLDNRFDLQSLVHRPVLYDALRRMIIRPIVTNQTFCVFLFFFPQRWNCMFMLYIYWGFCTSEYTCSPSMQLELSCQILDIPLLFPWFNCTSCEFHAALFSYLFLKQMRHFSIKLLKMFILDSAVTFFTAVNIEATKYSTDTSLGWVSKNMSRTGRQCYVQ